MKRFGVMTFGAVLLATAILTVLGYLSLRHGEASAELLLREQARDMAVMAAEKIEMAIPTASGVARPRDGGEAGWDWRW